MGFPTAWFIATRPPRSRALWLFLITIPFWTNLLIRTFAINEIIRNEGLLNTHADLAGRHHARRCQMIYTDAAVFVGMTYVYLPLMVLPLFASIDRFDMRLLEAGYDLYASRWQVLRRVILPIVKPGIIAGSILVFVPSLGAYVTPRILGGGKNMMIGNFIELQFGQGRNWPLGRVAVGHAAGHRDGGAAGLCALCQPGCQPWPTRTFSISRLPGFTTIAIAGVCGAVSADHHAGGLFVQRGQIDCRLGGLFAALVRRGLGQ